MGRTSKCLRILAAAGLSGAAALYCGDIAAQSVSPTMPPPNRNITAPAPQRQTAPSPRVNRLPGEKAPQPILKRTGDGVIAGYVWWDGNTTSHIPAKNCSGLSITVSAGSPSQSSPTLEQFSPIGTYTDNFTYIPNIGTDGVCAFAVHQMPVGQDLQVKLDVSPATAFSPISAPAIAITPIKIINGKCNNLPPAVPSPSVLTSNWWTCGNSAYNVNFALRPSAHMMSSGGGTGNAPRFAQCAADPVIEFRPTRNAEWGHGTIRGWRGARRPIAGWRNAESGKQGSIESAAVSSGSKAQQCGRNQNGEWPRAGVGDSVVGSVFPGQLRSVPFRL